MSYEIGSRYPKPGDKVRIVEKKNYSSGKLTEGVVKDVLTGKRFHPRGHKVRLINGIIGRVQEFSDEQQSDPPSIEETPSVPYTPSEDDLA
ncbi:MAG: YwbE family protein [Candidatus Woykebacteria bacterium]